MIIQCPQCGRKNEIEHVERGRHIECTCGSRFFLDDLTVIADYSSIDRKPPEMIGPYKVERFIGRGGSGTVYKGIHPQLQLPVAIKMLLPEYADNPVFKDRFIKSAKICAKLNHPNIVRIYDFGTTKSGELYLVMEYIAGGTLLDLLIRSGPLDPMRTAKIAASVCDGLEVAWRHGIIHRDIKPDNIMITSEGEYKLSDLGLSKYEPVSSEPAAHNTLDSDTLELSSLGTPEYTAPEQSVNAGNCDIRADIYSLGITLYQLLSGRLPFLSADPVELRRMHLEVEPRVPGFYRPGIPMDLEYIVMQCIQKRRSDRYQTPADLHADLCAFLNGTPLPSTTSGPQSFQPPVHIPRMQKKFSASSVVRCSAVLAVILIIGALIWYWSDRRMQTGETASSSTPRLSSLDRLPVTQKSANRDKFWEMTKAAALAAIRNRSEFAVAILNLKSFENDADPARRKEARYFLAELESAARREVAQRKSILDQNAKSLLQKEQYEEAIQLYEVGFSDLKEESRPTLEKIIFRLNEKIEKREARKNLEAEFLEKKIVPLLAAGEYTAAERLYRASGTDEKRPDPLILDLIHQCAMIPDLFAENMRSMTGKDCFFRFQNEPLASWSRDGIRILYIDPPEIFVRAEEKSSFTIKDLSFDEQASEMDKIISLSPDSKALWLAGASIRDFPENASAYLKMLPTPLKESYQHYLEERIRQRTTEQFRSELRSFLAEAGYMSKELPEPDQLPKIGIFNVIDPEDQGYFRFLYEHLDLLIRKYTGFSYLESYLLALQQIRMDMESRIFVVPLDEKAEPSEK